MTGQVETELELEAALIDGFERNERRAADEIYARIIGVVEGTLVYTLGGRDEHHGDLVQTAFEQIVRTLSRRRFERRCSLAAWASTVTAHVAFNALRTRMRERRFVDYHRDGDAEALVIPVDADMEHDLGVREELALVGRQLAQMNADRSTTLFLHGVLGHELTQVAALTGVSVAAAQSRLVRGRRELKDRLGIRP